MKKIFSLGKFVPALRHKHCIMHKRQRRNEGIYAVYSSRGGLI